MSQAAEGVEERPRSDREAACRPARGTGFRDSQLAQVLSQGKSQTPIGLLRSPAGRGGFGRHDEALLRCVSTARRDLLPVRPTRNRQDQGRAETGGLARER